MVTKAFILFAADPRPGVHPLGVDALWRIGCVQGETAQIHEVPIRTDASPDTIAETIYAALLELGHQRESVVLAIPSSMSLCASVRSAGLPARGRRSALMYRLEEHLPVSAEEVTADFAPAGDEMSLGVCVQNDSLAPLIESLAAKNIAIESISPTALLALQYESANKAGLDADAFLIGQEDEIELFQLKKGAPPAWYTVSQDLGAVLLHLKGREENPDRSLRVYAVGMLRPVGRCADESARDSTHRIARRFDLENGRQNRSLGLGRKANAVDRAVQRGAVQSTQRTPKAQADGGGDHLGFSATRLYVHRDDYASASIPDGRRQQ